MLSRGIPIHVALFPGSTHDTNARVLTPAMCPASDHVLKSLAGGENLRLGLQRAPTEESSEEVFGLQRHVGESGVPPLRRNGRHEQPQDLRAACSRSRPGEVPGGQRLAHRYGQAAKVNNWDRGFWQIALESVINPVQEQAWLLGNDNVHKGWGSGHERGCTIGFELTMPRETTLWLLYLK